MKILRYIPVLIFVLWGGFANAQSIFVVPSPLPSEIRGEAWDHPLATVEGYGELEFRDTTGASLLDVKYEGYIICDVEAVTSDPVDIDTKLEVRNGSDGIEVRARTQVGSISVNTCSVDTMTIDQSMALTAKKLKVEIEGFVPMAGYDGFDRVFHLFSEYEAEGKVESGRDPKVKLELENGKITMIPLCEYDCGGGVPPSVGGGPF